ncbi:hypothetical protein ACJX0J_029054, partial [Zea mays]
PLPRTSALRYSSLEAQVRDTIGEEVLRMFLKERQLHDDFVTKISDMVWRRNGGNVDAVEATTDQGSAIEVAQPEDVTATRGWVPGDSSPPLSKRLSAKNWQNESDKRKELNLLKYEALKDELLLLTTGIGAACSLYCLLVFSLETDVSYALGVGFSCLYLQLLCQHADNLSKQDIPQVFLKKKVKKIGITSEDLKNTIEKTLGGGGVALSSPRLVIPTVIFGLSALIDHFKNSFFSFEVLPRMMGFLAYKVAALVQSSDQHSLSRSSSQEMEQQHLDDPQPVAAKPAPVVSLAIVDYLDAKFKEIGHNNMYSPHATPQLIVLLYVTSEILRLNPGYKTPENYKPVLRETKIPVPSPKESVGLTMVHILSVGEILRLNPGYKTPENYKPVLRETKILVPVPHVQQAFTLDCGLACVLMVLRTLGIDCCDGIADLERLCRTTRFSLGLELHNFKYTRDVRESAPAVARPPSRGVHPGAGHCGRLHRAQQQKHLHVIIWTAVLLKFWSSSIKLRIILRKENIALEKMGLEEYIKDVSTDDAAEQASNLRFQINILWGMLLYERSVVEFKLGLSMWEDCLMAAIEKFKLGGASATYIAVLVKNHYANETAQDGLGFKIDEIVQAWNE